MYGYRVGHDLMRNIKTHLPAPSLKIKCRDSAKIQQNAAPKIECVFPSFCFMDPDFMQTVHAPRYADRSDPGNQVDAVCHRYACDMPTPQPKAMSDFIKFAKAFIVAKVPKAQQCDVKTFDEWLESTGYPPGRCRYLRNLHATLRFHNKDLVVNEAFLKWEGYAEYKHPRAINSYSDASKCILGPIQQAIDKALFRTQDAASAYPFFVKGTAPKTWPSMLEKTFGTDRVGGTDFTSFEAHHRDAFSEIIHFWMMHAVRDLDMTCNYKRMVSAMVKGVNKSKFQHLVAEVDQRLMSGALWTSSANGLLNLLVLSWLNGRTANPDASIEWLIDHHGEYFRGFVEGDDGIFTLPRRIPQALIDSLGLRLKFDEYDHFSMASFCGIVCDEQGTTCVTDPAKVTRNFFCLHPKYQGAKECTKMALMRAKALSYAYNFYDTPIIGELCRKVCEKTRVYDTEARKRLSELDAYKRGFVETAYDELHELVKRRPLVPPEAYHLVERNFGIGINDQLRIEDAIRTADHAIFVNLDCFSNPTTLEHAARYITRLPPIDTPHTYPAYVQDILDNDLVPELDAARPAALASRAYASRRHPELVLEQLHNVEVMVSD